MYVTMLSVAKETHTKSIIVISGKSIYALNPDTYFFVNFLDWMLHQYELWIPGK
jgi:hypothetical protein